ncbi:hypothetical protein IGI04_023568 [Brassica rapa subsp. trilocularis]|uniref:Fe2OG dioxygenase domain-containing protein n=1 Tax=Brassica rapa subsp. trilocularis TaxID=1813537 RepID=A0ABQ7M5P1_BRACM|nr:hypothetical protein IGI04_023568 [Brassica rapa subsp. trilocularis]
MRTWEIHRFRSHDMLVMHSYLVSVRLRGRSEKRIGSWTEWVRKVCKSISRILALALNLDVDYFDTPEMLGNPIAVMRLLHYEGKSDPSRGIYACGAHSDFGMMTLLATDGVMGLQICKDKDAKPRKWEYVPSIKGAYILNLGDLLERWSNGLFKSTLHRVLGNGQDRYFNSGKHGLSLLRSSGDSIRRFDENARTGVVSMFGKVQSLHSDRTLARARSLCSDRAKRVLGRYVATELRLELGRYVIRKIPTSRWVRPLLRLRFQLLRRKCRLVLPVIFLFREKLVRRQAEKELAQTGSEFPSSSVQVVAPCGTDVAAPLPQALPAGSSTTPILVEDKEKAADSMPPPPARKEIVLALRTPSAILATQPKSRKRKLAKSGDGETSQRGGSSLASGLRGKFISLIDGMISECGSETSRLSGELVELQGRWSETEAMLTAVEDSHSAKVAKLEVAIGELERDIGKTASSLLKEKKARKAKSSEVRRLQRQIESDAGLARRGIQEATDALRAEFQARLAKISASLGSLECIRSRDFALATIEGGMAVVRSFQSETPLTLEAEEARLSGCKGDMAAEDGDFDLILADLKSACFLPTCSEDPEGKDPMVGENGSDAAPGSDEAAGEEGA